MGLCTFESVRSSFPTGYSVYLSVGLHPEHWPAAQHPCKTALQATMDGISNEKVRQALQKDQGEHAKLLSWSSAPLSVSDGATSTLYNVIVKFEAADKEGEVCYAAKTNPTRESLQKDFHNLLFANECRFFTEVVPAITSVLEEVGEKPVRFPTCYHACLEKGREILFMENMQKKGYEMRDKALGLDLAHTCLVLRELGKLHASSVLLQNKITGDLTDKFDFFKTEWYRKFNWGCDWISYMSKLLGRRLKMFEEMGNNEAVAEWIRSGCETVAEWIRRVTPELSSLYEEQVTGRPPFVAIIHGDCWINNMLFRYDTAGSPVEVVFLDLQVPRIASVALDLQHFLNLNVHDQVRRPNFNNLLATYYDSFCSTMGAGNTAVPFTLEQLKMEYVNKGLYGVVYSILWIPAMMRMEEVSFEPDNEQQYSGDVQGVVDKLRPTLLSVVEEWIERGVIA